MWNKAAQKVWKEENEDFIAEKPAVASSSEILANHLGTKRQRRPSVRLEDIGDRPAAIVAEKKRKKLFSFFASSIDTCPDKSTPSLEADEPLHNTSKVLKVRPLVYVNNGDSHERASNHDGSDVERQTVRHNELASPSSSTPVESWQQEPQTALCNANEGPIGSHFLKPVSKKGRNGNRKRGRPKAAASVKQFASVGLSVTSERVPHIKNAIDVHSEEENDARTPEGFRDCDLETSDYFNDAKDLSNLQGSKPSKNGDMSPLRGEQECQSRGAYENGPSRQEHEFAERDKELSASQQVSEEGLMQLNKEPVERNKEGGVWTGTADKNETNAVDCQILTETNRIPHANKVKSNEHQASREPPTNNGDLPLAIHSPPLLNGVRGWLQNLGLGKYAQQFEAHEVDIEVLPLLTFDDLKEMGISAVGSRRKLFFAIQQLGKCLLVKAD